MANKKEFLNESAITQDEQDVFNFKHYAKKVQQLIQANADNPEPLTIGIYGKWGEGKTSFLNLIENRIDLWKKDNKGILKYHFNPWRYSTEDEMLFDFFEGLSRLMKVSKLENYEKASKKIVSISRYLKSVRISHTAGIPGFLGTKVTYEPSEILKALGEKASLSLDEIIAELNSYLDSAGYKVVVFIDDIDRLDKNEIYTILKLVKLNASFKNFVYILALDDEQVAKAIGKRFGENGKDGKLFLEKIINIPIYLPRIESQDYKIFLELKLSQVSRNLNLNEYKQGELNDVLYEYKYDFFRNGREVVKVINSFFISAFAIGDEVNLRDLFWIEYLKICFPSIYKKIKEYNMTSFKELKLLTYGDIFSYGEMASANDVFIGLDTNNILPILFPIYDNDKKLLSENNTYINQTTRGLRVNSPEHFEKYFSFHLIRKISEQKKELIKESIQNKSQDTLKAYLLDLKASVEGRVYKYFRVLEAQINKNDSNREFLYNFVIENPEVVPKSQRNVLGLDYRLQLIESMSFNLNRVKPKFDVIELAKKLDIEGLCHFTRKIKNDDNLRENLNILIAERSEDNFTNIASPFYYNTENRYNRMIMECWKQHKYDSFKQFIYDSLIDINSIIKLVRNFPTIWDNIFYDVLTEENYFFMKELLDVNLIYERVSIYDRSYVDNIIVEDYKLSTKDDHSEEETLEQFLYWYKKDNCL
jgi:hypothetical protein